MRDLQEPKNKTSEALKKSKIKKVIRFWTGCGRGLPPLKEETLQMRARDLHGQIITPTHRPEEKGGFSPGSGTV